MKNLSEGNIYKNFILFALPLISAGLFSQFYSVFDTVIAGKYLGEHGLGAVGATADFITFLSSPFWGYSSGIAVYIATLFGARRFGQMKSTLLLNGGVLVLSALLLGVLCVIFIEPLFMLFKVDSLIVKEAKIYFIICILGLCLTVMPNFFFTVMSSLGVSMFPFMMSLLMGGLNIIGNIFSVVVFDFGVAGIAASTVLAALTVNVLYIFKLRKCLKELGVLKEKVELNFSAFRQPIRYAVPNMLQQTAMYFAGMAMTPVVNGLGASATAGYSVTQRMFNMSACIYQNSARALATHSAQCVGGGKISELRRGWRAGLLQGTLVTAPVILACVLFARPICALFFPSDFQGAALDYAVFFARVCLPFIYLNLLDNLYHARFRGMGAMNVNLATTFFASVIRILAGAILSIPFGMRGVFFGMALAWGAESVLCFAIDRVRFHTDEKILCFLVEKGTLPESAIPQNKTKF